MTSGQSGKKQIPSVTGNLAQMIVCVHIVNMWVNELRKMGGAKYIQNQSTLYKFVA